MIDRNMVIDGLECCTSIFKKCENGCPYYNKTDFSECNILKKDALFLLKEQGWHTLKEDKDGVVHGLPGDDGQYLMTDGKDIWIDDYVDGVDDGVWLDSGRDIREIRAWMYMPELPILD